MQYADISYALCIPIIASLTPVRASATRLIYEFLVKSEY